MVIFSSENFLYSERKSSYFRRTSRKVKVIVEPKYQEIVGISIIGPHATELIGQGTVMIHTEVTADIMRDYIAAHPTLSEAIHEALMQAVGHAVHA